MVVVGCHCHQCSRPIIIIIIFIRTRGTQTEQIIQK